MGCGSFENQLVPGETSGEVLTRSADSSSRNRPRVKHQLVYLLRRQAECQALPHTHCWTRFRRCRNDPSPPCVLRGPYRNGPASGENKRHLCKLRVLGHFRLDPPKRGSGLVGNKLISVQMDWVETWKEKSSISRGSEKKSANLVSGFED